MLQHHNPEPLHVYTEQGRFYKVGDKLYPGVGSIQDATRPDLARKWKQWREIPENVAISATACERGTLFHQAMEQYLTASCWDDEDDEQLRKSFIFPYVQSVQPVLPKIQNPQLVESAVWHEIACYAGTVDLVADYEGELSIIDWKTSEQPKVEIPERYLLQLAAYCGAVNRMYDLKIKQGVIIAANAEQECQVFKFPLAAFWKLWIRRVKLYWQQQPLDEFTTESLRKLNQNY